MIAKQPKINRKDWRHLPLDQWNTLTMHTYFADMNREYYGVETYLPLRNWRFEQGAIKRAIDTYGAGTLKAACDIAFSEYRPTAEFPLLTAGFAIAYRVNAIIPRIVAESKRKELREKALADANGGMSAEELDAWL